MQNPEKLGMDGYAIEVTSAVHNGWKPIPPQDFEGFEWINPETEEMLIIPLVEDD
jgi:hypothetical protein